MTFGDTGRIALVSLLGVGASARLMAACDPDEAPPATSSGMEAGAPDAQRPAPGEDGGALASCKESCDQTHPGGRAKDQALVACWEANCRAPCIAEEPDAGDADGGRDGGAPAACVSDVVTVNATCDACTRAACCPSWDGCFQDPDCSALNRCYQACD